MIFMYLKHNKGYKVVGGKLHLTRVLHGNFIIYLVVVIEVLGLANNSLLLGLLGFLASTFKRRGRLRGVLGGISC